MHVTLSDTVQILLAISAVIVALKNIFSFIRQPVDLANRRVREQRTNITEEINLEISKSEKRMSELLEGLEEKTNKSIENINSEISEAVASFTGIVNQGLADLCGNLTRLINVDKEALRVIIYREIERIHEEGIERKTLTTKGKENLSALFMQYQLLEGNGGGYIPGLVSEMMAWETAPSKGG